MSYSKICKNCGKQFTTNVVARQYCSVSCSSAFRGHEKYMLEVQSHLERIKTCKTQRELRDKYPSTYRFSKYHHLPEFVALPTGDSQRKVYTFDEVYTAAKKYKTKADFHANDLALYFCALRRGWMEHFDWLSSGNHLYDHINYVYRYYFPLFNAIYVGRTINPEIRDIEHRRNRGKCSSAVFQFAKKKNIRIPEMELLESGLSGEESQIKEDEYVALYREEGYQVLNKGGTGIGIGSMGGKKKHSRKQVIEIAKQYKWLSDFKKEHHNLYVAASRYGWISDLGFLKRKQREHSLFSKQYCIGVAKLFNSRKELSQKDSSVYDTMLRKGWLEECPWLVSSHQGYRKLTHDLCLDIASRYRNLTEMHREQPTIVKKLYKTGWIKECTWIPKYSVRTR